jgi:glucuronyl/N-acetylglucosaminyl transferase EXT2
MLLKRNKRKNQIILTQLSIDDVYKEELEALERSNSNRLKLFRKCPGQSYFSRCKITDKSIHSYTSLIQSTRFCLIIKNLSPDQSAEIALFDALRFNCLPIIVANEWIVPFSDIIDWSLISIRIDAFMLKNVFKIIDKYSEKELNFMFHQMDLIYRAYFSSMRAITSSVLDILSSRVYSAFKRPYKIYNFQAEATSHDPFIIRYDANKNLGFTLVIVSHDQDYFKNTIATLNSGILFEKNENLNKILLLWYGNQEILTNQKNEKLAKNKRVVLKSMHANGMFQSRFLPFDEIKTEAVLVLEDFVLGKIDPYDLSHLYFLWLERPTTLHVLKSFKNLNEHSSPFIYNYYLNKHFYNLHARKGHRLNQKNFYCENFRFLNTFSNLTIRHECFDSETVKCKKIDEKAESFAKINCEKKF